MNFQDAFTSPGLGQRGLAAQTAAPDNVESDLPPGAPPYAAGPLANPRPSPSPAPQSLETLANGGFNHAQLWMSGQSSAPVQQQPFAAPAEPDLPPGADGTYYGGPLAQPKPTPSATPSAIKPFTWSAEVEHRKRNY